MREAAKTGDLDQLKAMIGRYVYEPAFAKAVHKHKSVASLTAWLAEPEQGFDNISPEVIQYLTANKPKEVLADVFQYVANGRPSAKVM